MIPVIIVAAAVAAFVMIPVIIVAAAVAAFVAKKTTDNNNR